MTKEQVKAHPDPLQKVIVPASEAPQPDPALHVAQSPGGEFTLAPFSS